MTPVKLDIVFVNLKLVVAPDEFLTNLVWIKTTKAKSSIEKKLDEIQWYKHDL